jgi:hypothetical protein
VFAGWDGAHPDWDGIGQPLPLPEGSTQGETYGNRLMR